MPVPGPVEQDAAGDPRAQRAVALGPLEEVDDLDELVLGLVDPRDVVEGDSLLLAVLEAPSGRPPEAAEHARRPAQLATREPDEEPDQEQGGQEAEEQRRPQRTSLVRRLGVDHHFLVGEGLGEPGAIDERRHLGFEARHLDRLLIPGRVVGRRLAQLTLDGIGLRGDLVDVAGRHGWYGTRSRSLGPRS